MYENSVRLEPVRLTKRELVILTCVAEGTTSKQIAIDLFVTKRAVEWHIQNIYGKLEVHSRIQMLRKAATLGYLQLRE